MDYPEDFPKDLQPPVDAAIADAELEVRRLAKKGMSWDGTVLVWVARIFFVFAEQACEAGRQGIWTGQTIRKRLDWYLYKLSTHAHQQYGPRLIGRHLVSININNIAESVKGLPQWETLLQKLKDTALSVVLSPSRGSPDTAVDDAPPAKKLRQYQEPKPELLKDPDASLGRLRAAEALGITPRTIDRWINDKKLTPIGSGSRKRFKAKDLKKLLDQKNLDKRDPK